MQQYGVVDRKFVEQLTQILSPGRVLWRHGDDADACRLCETEYSIDRSMHPNRTADVVVLPETVEEVQRVVQLCAKTKVIVVPRGAGTGLEGGAVAYMGGVVVDVMRLKAFEAHPDDFFVVCGPGWLKNDINKRLADYGLFFGPDPSSNPSVGGMASTGGSGLSTLKYGTTKENLVSLKVLLLLCAMAGVTPAFDSYLI